ncbi:serpin family protein [Anaerobacillus alkaliphilus]|uniref:Serpin family protein n=1 Tax=Anaerobacillus alkaliphilus TaxID=1548597 RepID=A0A4V1LGP0_9BACI|nr:serpin family protein [Anaerobacillus alkaliphilus]RXJ02490.1 serpin family protein [Anaerobacillus alkaliphilus]
MAKKLLLLFLILILASCGQLEQKNNLSFSNDDVHKDVVLGINEFSIDLLKNLREPNENLLVSPLSISLALAMTVNGADGDTREEMLKVMHQSGVSIADMNSSLQALQDILTYSDTSVQLFIANSLWGREDKSFYEAFINQASEFYSAKLTLLDFQSKTASETINSWVKEKTLGKIEEIVEDDIDPNTVLFLINAIYFKGDWQQPFLKERTREQTFFPTEGQDQRVQMMFNEGNFQYFEKDAVQGIRLPYGEGRIVMDILLPENMDELLTTLTIDQWQEWLSSYQQVAGQILLPRFTLEYEESLVTALKTLGMEVAFDDKQANFSKIAPVPPNLYISEILHKTFIEVNEEGTEAAAVTSVEIAEESAQMFELLMEVNRPFLYVIQDSETGAILFMGITEQID